MAKKEGKSVKDFDRQELQNIRVRADTMATDVVTNVQWKKAYLDLAAAADNLDARIARTEERAA